MAEEGMKDDTAFKKPFTLSLSIKRRPQVTSNALESVHVPKSHKKPSVKSANDKTEMLSETVKVEPKEGCDPSGAEVLADVGAQPELDQSVKPESTAVQDEQASSRLPRPTEPSWAGPCPAGYSFEILKGGIRISCFELADQTSVLFGRLNECDIELAHPSISRHHALLVYRIQSDPGNNEAGWYLKDMGSTHGTFVNKQRIRPDQYTRIRTGHLLKFGLSTRLYLLQGPDDDTEPESAMSLTEMKQELAKRKRLEEEATKAKEARKIKEQKKLEQLTECSWGIGSDEVVNKDESDEDEEEECGESVDFMSAQEREDYYINDPEKALKTFFDREDQDMEFEYMEKGSTCNHLWCCRIELPVAGSDGSAVTAEATVSGTRKAARIQCALEACRILDSYGVLRQSSREARKRKHRNWKENDYYDSDEDEFLDRTGEVAKKRDSRKRRFAEFDLDAEPDAQQVDTYDTLLEKLKKVEAAIPLVEEELNAIRQLNANSDGREKGTNSISDGDSLDSFMAGLESNPSATESTLELRLRKSILRQRLDEMKAEKKRLEQLSRIAKPTKLPELRKYESPASAKLRKSNLLGAIRSYKGDQLRKNDLKGNSGDENKDDVSVPDTTLGENTELGTIKDDTLPSCANDSFLVDGEPLDAVPADPICAGGSRNLEQLSDHKAAGLYQASFSDLPDDLPSSSEVTGSSHVTIDVAGSTSSTVEVSRVSPSYSIGKDPEASTRSKAGSSSSRPVDPGADNTVSRTSKKATVQAKPVLKQSKLAKPKIKFQYDASDPKYAMWLPPSDQSGDGRTNLNDKLGY